MIFPKASGSIRAILRGGIGIVNTRSMNYSFASSFPEFRVSIHKLDGDELKDFELAIFTHPTLPRKGRATNNVLVAESRRKEG